MNDLFVHQLETENKQLRKRIKLLEEYGEAVGERRNELYDKIDKAIEYIKEHNVIATNKEYLPKDYEYCCSYELLEILGDKEIKEIPQFKGTLEQLDNLTILGDKENE